MFNELALVTVTNFSGGTPDKNGKLPVMLQAIAGKIPNRNVRAGTISENKGIRIGNAYLIQFRELPEDPQFGRQFDFLVIRNDLSIHDIIEGRKELGDPEVVPIEKPENADKVMSGTGGELTAEVVAEPPLAEVVQ